MTFTAHSPSEKAVMGDTERMSLVTCELRDHVATIT